MFGSSRFFALMGVLAVSLCSTPVSHAAYNDPPGRVARLNDSLGEISYSPAGEDQWIGIARNRPLIGGDRIWTDRNARAEFQVGNAAVRLGPETSMEILDLDDQIAQIQLTQGTLNLRVRRLYSGQVFEVDTPTLAFTIDQAGSYRIDVDPDNDQTTIVVRQGAGVAYGENSRFPLRAGDAVRFYQADLNDHDMYGLPRADAFDRYCFDRDQRLDRSISLRYVDDDVIGYADLDQYGSWRSVSNYGNVWFPSRVDANWAPYRDGRWVWQEPWGWTWVDDAPWGFAPSHYGRWAHVSNRWGWIPGPRHARAVYAPALVVFIGGRGWSISLSQGRSSSVGWFPLGPRDVYVPSYRASRDYFSRVNVNNTVVNNTIINNVYNNYATGNINVTQANYANRAVAGAATAVPSTVFVNSQPVRQASTRLDRNVIGTGEITRVAPIAPSARSVLGPGAAARVRPSREVTERQVFARNAPPPGERPFAAREQQLRQNPGRAPSQQLAEPGQNRNVPRNVRVIAEQAGAVNAREASSSRAGMPAAGNRERAPLQPLDRSVEPIKGRGRLPADRNQGQGREIQGNAAQPAPRDQQTTEQQRVERERQAAEQQRVESQRQTQLQQQQMQQQRQAQLQQAQAQDQQRAEREKQAAEQQRVERQRQAQLQQQQAQQQRQAEIQQKQTQDRLQAEREQQAAEQQRAERQRQAQLQQQQAQQQRQAEIQQKQAQDRLQAEREQQAAEQQRVERQRQAQLQQQQAQQQRQAEIQQKQAQDRLQAEREQQAAEQQRVERQRQAQLQQQQAQQQRQAEIQQKQAQDRLQAEREQQAAEQQRVERQRQAQLQQQQQVQQQQMQVARERQAQARQQAQAQPQPQTAQQEQVDCQPSKEAVAKGKRDNRTGKESKGVDCKKQE